MANTVSNIFGKLKTKFSGLSPQNILEQSELDASLDNNKTIKISNPKSERYTYLPGITGTKFLKNFKPQSREEKDTLSPIGFFRVGEIDEQKNKKIAEQIKKAAADLGRKKLTKGQEQLVRKQAEQEQMFTQDVPSTAIKKLKYDPKTEELYVTFQGSNKKYWYPNVPKEKVEEMMAAPSKGEYFMQNIHDQHSVNYQLHKTHKHQDYLGSNRQIKKYYKKMREPYAEGKRKGTMKGVLNNGRN
jgi:hypothetical protein